MIMSSSFMQIIDFNCRDVGPDFILIWHKSEMGSRPRAAYVAHTPGSRLRSRSSTGANAAVVCPVFICDEEGAGS